MRGIMAIVHYNILLMMAKVFQLNGILTSDVASEMDEGKYREKKNAHSSSSSFSFCGERMYDKVIIGGTGIRSE